MASKAAAGTLFAGHHLVWEASGVSKVWASAVAGDSLASVATGSLATHPATIAVVGGDKKDIKDVLAHLSDAQKEKLDARVKVRGLGGSV